MMFMQDNCPLHASKYSTACLASKGLKDERMSFLTWPPSSPDLNPIENLALLKQEIYSEGKQYTSLNSGRLWLLLHKKLIVNRSTDRLDEWKAYDLLQRRVAILVTDFLFEMSEMFVNFEFSILTLKDVNK